MVSEDLSLPEEFLEQLLSNHNNRQILLLLVKIYSVFDEISDRWEKAQMIFDNSWDKTNNFFIKEDFTLYKLDEVLGDDQDFKIDLRNLSLILNPSYETNDNPAQILSGIQIVSSDSGTHNFWITKKSFIHLLNQLSIYENGKEWTLGRLNSEIKFFRNLLIPNQNERITLVNEKPPMGNFVNDNMKMISINSKIIPLLQKIFEYNETGERLDFLEQIELDKALIEIETELDNRNKEIIEILEKISPDLTKKKFLKSAYRTIDSIDESNRDSGVVILKRVLDNNPNVKSQLNYDFDDEHNMPSWSGPVGEIIKFKKTIDNDKENFERLKKEKIMKLNYPDINKLILNHSNIFKQLNEIKEEINKIIPRLSEIKGRFTVIIRTD